MAVPTDRLSPDEAFRRFKVVLGEAILEDVPLDRLLNTCSVQMEKIEDFRYRCERKVEQARVRKVRI